MDRNIFQAFLNFGLPGLALAALKDFLEQLAQIFGAVPILLRDGRKLLRRLAVQSVAAAEDLVIRIPARIAGQPLMDHAQKLGHNGRKLSVLELPDL